MIISFLVVSHNQSFLLQIGLLWHRIADHGLVCAVGVLRFLLSLPAQSHLSVWCDGAGPRLNHCFTVGQVFGAEFTTTTSR